MRVWLQFMEGSLAGQSREFTVPTKGHAMIGRGSHCDVVLGEGDRAASSSHAKLWLDGNNLYLTDVGSHYGTYVNDKATTKARLRQSDRVRFGFKGPLATVSFSEAWEGGPSLPAPPSRPRRQNRPVAMTTVRAVHTELAAPKEHCPVCTAELTSARFKCLKCERTVCTSHFAPQAGSCEECAAQTKPDRRTIAIRAARPEPAAAPAPKPAAAAAPAPAPVAAQADAAADFKACPFCAEPIRAAAIKCRFCGEFIPQAAPTPDALFPTDLASAQAPPPPQILQPPPPPPAPAAPAPPPVPAVAAPDSGVTQLMSPVEMAQQYPAAPPPAPYAGEESGGFIPITDSEVASGQPDEIPPVAYQPPAGDLQPSSPEAKPDAWATQAVPILDDESKSGGTQLLAAFEEPTAAQAPPAVPPPGWHAEDDGTIQL